MSDACQRRLLLLAFFLSGWLIATYRYESFRAEGAASSVRLAPDSIVASQPTVASHATVDGSGEVVPGAAAAVVAAPPPSSGQTPSHVASSRPKIFIVPFTLFGPSNQLYGIREAAALVSLLRTALANDSASSSLSGAAALVPEAADAIDFIRSVAGPLMESANSTRNVVHNVRFVVSEEYQCSHNTVTRSNAICVLSVPHCVLATKHYGSLTCSVFP